MVQTKSKRTKQAKKLLKKKDLEVSKNTVVPESDITIDIPDVKEKAPIVDDNFVDKLADTELTKETDKDTDKDTKASDNSKVVQFKSVDKTPTYHPAKKAKKTKKQDKSPKLSNDEKIKQALSEEDDDKAIQQLEELDLSVDKVIDKMEDSGLIDQNEQAITYAVNNLYSDKKKRKFRRKMELRANPPELKIESTTGDTARFYLTKELNNNLVDVLTDVKKAYVGMKKTEQHTAKIPASKRGFGKLVALVRLHSREVVIAMIWAVAGLFYSSQFVLGSAIAVIIGLIAIFYPTKKDKEE